MKETLTMYARCRGVPEKQIADEVDGLISKLLLSNFVKTQAGNLRYDDFEKYRNIFSPAFSRASLSGNCFCVFTLDLFRTSLMLLFVSVSSILLHDVGGTS